MGASVIASTSVAPPPPPALRAASTELRLAAASSVLNVPVNLLIDLINIPYNEVRALDYTARAFLFSGPWFVVGATNVWGVDQGDPMKFMSLVNTLVPFPALSGMGLDQFDQNGLGQQVWMYVATQLPTSVFCDDDGCPPSVPTSPITGFTGLDQTIWGLALTLGLYGFAPDAPVKFPLYNNWFQVPVSDLIDADGFTFGPDWPGLVSPGGQIFPGLGFVGTNLVDGQHVFPWAGMTFKLDLSKPLTSYFDHLMADPATNPIQFPTFEQVGRAIQSFAAAMVVAFDPLTPGSGLCTADSGAFGNCGWLPPELDYPGIVKSISDLWPGNTVINEWLDAYANGTANVPTQEQIDKAFRLALLNSMFWDFGNPNPPPEVGGSALSALAPFFHQLWTNLGLNPPPLNAPDDQTGDSATGESTTALLASGSTLAKSVSEPTTTEATITEPTSPALDGTPVAPEGQVTNNEITQTPQTDLSSVTTSGSEPATATATPHEPEPTDVEGSATDKGAAGDTEAPADRDTTGDEGEKGEASVGGRKPQHEARSTPRHSAADSSAGTGTDAHDKADTGRSTGNSTDTGNSGGASTGGGGANAGSSNSGGASTGGRHRAA